MLSDSDSDGDNSSLHRLTINEHYAKAFQYRKEREELQKLKDKYGSDYSAGEENDDDDDEETDSESAESEDEVGEELTPQVDAAILRTLARIKRKDPEIYDSKTDIFTEEQKKIKSTSIKRVTKPSKDKSKPITIRQVALEAAIHDGVASSLSPSSSRSSSPQPPLPHVEEQIVLRKETIAAIHGAIDQAPDDEDELLVLREKTQDEREREEEEYRAYLEREVGEDLKGLVTVDAVTHEHEPLNDDDDEGHEVDVKKKRKDKKDKKDKKKGKKKEGGEVGEKKGGKSKQEEDQEFLMNYILNRGWIDRNANHIPTYGEITSKTRKKKGKEKDTKTKLGESSGSGEDDSEGDGDEQQDSDGDLDKEEEFEDIVDLFESSYNFRFEEPDAATIKSFPRNLPSLVRREDTTRKDARERRKQRKEEELLKKREEVKRLRGLKMKEIRRKLEIIGREGGKDIEHDTALRDLDLEGDWDPEAHDKQMAELYGDDGFGGDDEKPQWEDDIDIADIVQDVDDLSDGNGKKKSKKSKKKQKQKQKQKQMDEEEDGGGVDIDAMDADVERVDGGEEEEWDGTEEMRKRKLDEYMEEVYKLNFNDLVGDLPTRFKYVPVQPQNFALTPVEILMATDQELNEYMGVKKYAPYRKEVKWDSTRNSRLQELKQKMADRGAVAPDARERNASGEERPKKRKGKKERMKAKAGGEGEGEGVGVEEVGASSLPPARKAAPIQTKTVSNGHTPALVEMKRKRSIEVEDSEPSKKRKRKRKHAKEVE